MDRRYAFGLVGTVLALLAALRLAAPGRPDLSEAAAAGAAFAGIIMVAGHEAVRRGVARSAQVGMQIFLAAMTVKVLAFAAFLLTLLLTTRLHPAGLAGGLIAVTLVGETLGIAALRRANRGADAAGGRRERPPGGGEDRSGHPGESRGE